MKTFEQNADVYIFLILLKNHIFSFSTALQRLKKILTGFPVDKISKMYPDLQMKKVTPPALNALCFLLKH